MLRQFAATCGDLKKAVTTWTTLNADVLTSLNGVLATNGLKAIPAVAPALAAPVCAPAPESVASRKPKAGSRKLGAGSW